MFFPILIELIDLDTIINENEMALPRKKALILVSALFSVSYFLLYSAIACVLSLLGDQMTGLFRGIVIVSAAGISALFFINRTHRHPTSSEKTYLIFINLFVTVTIDIIAGRIFEIKAPPAIIWIFDVFVLWSAFGPMSKRIAPQNDDNRKQTY